MLRSSTGHFKPISFCCLAVSPLLSPFPQASLLYYASLFGARNLSSLPLLSTFHSPLITKIMNSRQYYWCFFPEPKWVGIHMQYSHFSSFSGCSRMRLSRLEPLVRPLESSLLFVKILRYNLHVINYLHDRNDSSTGKCPANSRSWQLSPFCPRLYYAALQTDLKLNKPLGALKKDLGYIHPQTPQQNHHVITYTNC